MIFEKYGPLPCSDLDRGRTTYASKDSNLLGLQTSRNSLSRATSDRVLYTPMLFALEIFGDKANALRDGDESLEWAIGQEEELLVR